MTKTQARQARKAVFANAPGRQQLAMTSPKRKATISSSALRQIKDDSPAIRRKRRNRAQTDRTWQQEAFDYAGLVGELGALLTLQSNIVSLCGFPVRRWDNDESDWVANDPEFDTPAPDKADKKAPPTAADATPDVPPAAAPEPKPKVKSKYDDRPANVMRAFVGPDGGAVDLYRRAAYNLFCAGDCTLLGTSHPKDTGILWEFLSVLELFPNADGRMVRRRGGVGSELEELPEDNFTGRCYRSDIAYSDLSSSEVKRVLPILQEIVTLTMMVDAIAKSRVPANLLFIPEGLSFVGAKAPGTVEGDPEGDEGEDGEQQELVDELFDHMTAPFNDPGSAARLVPLVITGPLNEHTGLSGIEVIDLSRSFDAFAQELRAEALQRLAQGLDAPPEALSGKGSVNHWTAANIDSEFIVKHIQPIGILVADFLTWAYLRPMLEAYEGMSADEAMMFKIEFDPSPVIARADEAKSARDLSDWLSDDAILAANGFTKADMAGTEVIRQRRLWTLVSTQPGQFGKLLPLLTGFEDVDPELIGTPPPPPVAEPPADEQPPDGKQPPVDGKVANTGDEVPAKAAPRGVNNAQDDQAMTVLVERLVTAADAAVGRALERSGAKVISLAQSKNPELKARLTNARKDRVMSLVTSADLAQLSITPRKLLDKSWDDIAAQAREWIQAHLEANGVDAMEANDRAAFASHHLCERLQELTTTKLTTSWRNGPNGLRVANALVNEVLEQAAFAGAL